MGVFRRPDSPWWWLYLETAAPALRKEKTKIKIGTTAADRRDNRRLAEQVYAQRMRELATRLHRLPVDRAAVRFEAFAAIYARDVIPHNQGAERERELLKTLIAGFGHESLTSIDRESVQAWMTRRRQQVSARTVNREVDLLKAMLRSAVPKYLEASPIADMKRLKTVAPKRRLMSPAEEKKLLRQLEPEDQAILLIGLDSLCRLGDILDLRREDDHGKTLYIRDPKDPQQSTPYEVPVSKRVREALDALTETSPYYFPSRRGGATAHARGASVRMALKRACQRARIPYGRKANGITFHWATRRTGATRMLQRGAELKAVQAVGHWKRPDVMLEIYAETTTAATRRAVEMVGGYSRVTPEEQRRRRKSA